MKRGRPKGYSPYIELTYEELADYVGRKSVVRVSKAWWDALTGASEPTPKPTESSKSEEKIEFKLVNLNE